ncbi:hypothetical protein [Synechococcus sp. CCY 9618]|uniref:hypothetical protein n=1 Tax=Synechococcus sp. CCY 9618 TaxID=2815602 RepID=UPI001C24F3A9|nr:hypothetical protein [Synechococcus sp. CCY 9618]
MPLPPQPIVILGGFLIGPEAHAPMAARLGKQTGQPVRLVPVGKPGWLPRWPSWRGTSPPGR